MTIWSQKVKNREKSEKLFFLKKKKTGHQYRLKISLRIEWDHSQPLKITLKYRFAPIRHLYEKIL